MSNYYSLVTIVNNLEEPLTNGVYDPIQGTLVGDWPDTVAPGATSAQLKINAENAILGSEGQATYTAKNGDQTAIVTLYFKCNRGGQTSDSESGDISIVAYRVQDLDIPLTVTFGYKALAR